MSTVSVKCPNCGGKVELDGSKEFGFCMFCGAQVQVQDGRQKIQISGSVKFDEEEKYGNYLNLAVQSYDDKNYEEAYKYYAKSLEIKQSDYLPIFRKALCAGYISVNSGMRVEEVVSGVSKAFDLADMTGKKKISEDIVAFSYCDLKLNNDFFSSDDCARYVKTVYGKVSCLNRLFAFVDKENEAAAGEYCSTVLRLCGLIKSKMTYNAGTVVKKGKSKTQYGTYPVPQNIVNDVKTVCARFSQEGKRYMTVRAEGLKREIEEIEKEYGKLPTTVRWYTQLRTTGCIVQIICCWLILPLWFLTRKDGETLALCEKLTTEKKKKAAELRRLRRFI